MYKERKRTQRSTTESGVLEVWSICTLILQWSKLYNKFVRFRNDWIFRRFVPYSGPFESCQQATHENSLLYK